MELSDLLLKKEELPILYDRCFEIPIHPALLDTSLSFDPEIARKVFPKVAEEWYDDLKKYAENLENLETREWILRVFLKKRPQITSKNDQLLIDNFWQDDITTSSNGFASCLSISRNSGGTLYYATERDSEGFIAYDDNPYVIFSREKANEFGIEKIDRGDLQGVRIKKYSHHNVDNYPGALFLRNWAIKYMNEVFKTHPRFNL